VLEKIFPQVWSSVEVVSQLSESLGGGWDWLGDQVEPISLSSFLPGGVLHINQSTDLFAAELNMWNISLHGLSNFHLQEVKVLRPPDLSQLSLAAAFSLPHLVANGTYNATGSGWWGFSWTAVDSQGPRPFDLEIVNATASLQVNVDSSAACDPSGGARVTSLSLNLDHSSLELSMDNIDDGFRFALQSILLISIEAQKLVAQGAIKGVIASYLGELMCELA